MKIVMLAGKGISSRIVFHALSEQFDIDKVLIEEPVERSVFMKKRIKKLGLVTVAGQILFKLFVETLLSRTSRKRIREIKQQYKLNDSEIDADKAIHVDSANSDDAIALLRDLQPDIVVVNGTRIISKRVLQSVPATFINMHAGITPKYRGVHGAYWALANADAENCGVTVHLVDEGIDTGSVIYQTVIKTESRDNFVTYPYLQTASGVALEKKAISDIQNGCLKLQPSGPESRLYSHPTLWAYLGSLIFKGVK